MFCTAKKQLISWRQDCTESLVEKPTSMAMPAQQKQRKKRMGSNIIKRIMPEDPPPHHAKPQQPNPSQHALTNGVARD